MALKVAITQNKEVSAWREFQGAEFKIRGIAHKAFQVAEERARNQVVSKGYDVSLAGNDDKLFHELLLEAVASHLIEDWKGVEFIENEESVEPPYTPENAYKLLKNTDIGLKLWLFIKTEAEKLQKEADGFRDEVVGKSPSSTTTHKSTRAKVSTN
ncbi:hypothetical protein HCY58_10945 [Acinetobacter radioresistens]|uniref:hypothetical protein n=1 Tax=Acinetobacter radioresistens TaxID=40216 RepID=UPI0020058F5B|nr:hypothetical protein [Acinetobacter radioresistens]MCK4087564.1 hypothetical protein [Acinetobacter radioresistens]